MGQFVRTRIRCPLFPSRTADKFKMQDGSTSITIVKGAGCDFEFLLAENPLAPVPLDISNIASLTVMLKLTGSPGDPPAASKTVAALTQVASLDTWNSGAEQHAVAIFSAVEMNIAAGNYDITVYGVTTDDLIDIDVFGRGSVTIVDAGLSNVVQPLVGVSPGVTLEQLNGVFGQCLKKVMDPGDVLTLRSKNGSVNRILGVLNDASRQDDIEDV